MICIYKITNPNNKIYIGKTINFKKRINSYSSLHCKTQKLLYRSFVKYGFDNHKIEVLEKFNNDDILSEKEKFYIKQFNSYNYENDNGLNLTIGGEGIGSVSEYHKKKIILSNSTRVISEKTRLLMSEKRKERIYDPNTGIKISLALKGKSKNKKRKLSDLHKENISINNFKNKVIVDIETGIFFINVSDASESYGINRNTLKNYLNGNRKNKTALQYI